MISKLPVELQSAFRTGITITSLSQCVIELVLNSLDANASRIGVRVDLDKYNLQVVDNGCGIDREQLELVGERYMTSKCLSLADLESNAQYYGFRGEALASLKDACEALVVISKPEGHTSTFSKVMKGGSDINSRASKAMLNRPGNGTTIAVTNLFYNLPVRRRRMHSAIELEQLRHQMQAIALIHPKISFTLRDDVAKSIVFSTKKCSNIIENFNQISKLEFPADSFVEVTHSTHPTFKINGFVCKKTYKSKEHQYIYLNNRLVENKKLYAYFNHKLSKSFYFHSTKMKSVGSGFSKNFNFDTFKKSPETSTSVDYAIFIVNIMCPYREYDITLDPRKHLVEFKDWDEVLRCLSKSADKFVEHEKLLDNALLFRQPEGVCKKAENIISSLHHNLLAKESGNISPVVPKVGDVRSEKQKRKNCEIVEVDTRNDEEFKFSSAKAIHATLDNKSSFIAEICNDISTPHKKIGRNISNKNEKRDNTPLADNNHHRCGRNTSKKKRNFSTAGKFISRGIPNITEDNAPSPDKTIHISALDTIKKKRERSTAGKIIRRIQNMNKKSDNTPLPDKKIYEGALDASKKRIEPSSAGIIHDILNTPNESLATLPNNDVLVNNNMRDGNNCNNRICTENVNKENSSCMPIKMGNKKSCMKRPLSQGHSEHVTTECNFDFSSKLRKQMRFGGVEAPNYRTILPFVHAEIYETNLKEFKHSLTRLCGEIKKNVMKHDRIKISRTKTTVCDSQMKGSQWKNTKTSNSTTKQQNEVLRKKVVKFCDENCREKVHSRDPRIANVSKDMFSNCNTEKCDNLNKYKIDSFERKFQVNNHHLLRKHDNKYSPLNREENYFPGRKFGDNNILERRFEASRNISEGFNSVTQNKIGLGNCRIGPDTDSHKILGTPLKENTGEDLFLFNTALKRRCTSSECNDQDPSSFNSSKQPNIYDYRKSKSYKCFEPCLNKVEDSACNTSPNSCHSQGNILRKRQFCSDKDYTFGLDGQKSSGGELFSPNACEFTSSYTPEYVSNRKTSKLDSSHDSRQCCQKDSSNAIPNPQMVNINLDVPQNIDGNSNKNEITGGKNDVKSCSCKVSDVISFYKLKHNCCREQTNDENSKIEESKKSPASKEVDEVKRVSTTYNSLKLNQECPKQNNCRTNDDNGNVEQNCVVDRNIDKDELFVVGQEFSNKNVCQASDGNQNHERHCPSFENNTNDDSSITQYNSNDLIMNKKEDFKLSSIPPNKNSANGERQFSFYLKPRESNALKIFDSFSNSPDSSEDCHTFHKANSIQLQPSHSLDSFRCKYIEEFSPVIVDHDCDVSSISECSQNGHERSSRVEKKSESVDAFERNQSKESQNKNIIDFLPNQSHFFQFDDFHVKPQIRSNTPLKLKHFTTFEKHDLHECNTPNEKSYRSATPLKLSRSQKSIEIHNLSECNTEINHQIRSVSPLKPSLGTNSKTSEKHDLNDTNTSNEKSSRSATPFKLEYSRSQKSFENHDLCECNTPYEKITKGFSSPLKLSDIKITGSSDLSNDVVSRSELKTCIDHSSPLRTNSIFHESSEINSKVSETGEKKMMDKNELSMKLCEIMNGNNNCDVSSGDNYGQNSLGNVHMEVSNDLKKCTNDFPPYRPISFFHENVVSSDEIIPGTPEKKNKDETVLSKTTKIRNISGSNIFRKQLSSPPKQQQSFENNNNVNYSNSLITDEDKIEDETELRKNVCETVKSPYLSDKNDAISRMFDVKYLVSKEKVNHKVAVPTEVENCKEGEVTKPVIDGVHTADSLCSESKHIIGEDTNRYFVNATGFSFECNTHVVKDEHFLKEIEVCDLKNEQKQAVSKTSECNSMNSNFLNNLAEAYNFQLTPSSKLKAENMLGSTHSPTHAPLEWMEQTLPSGMKIFIHKSTGMSSYINPYVEHPKAFNTSSRNPLLPRGMSPILITPSNCTNEGLPDLTCHQKQYILDLAKDQKISTSKEMEDNLNERGKLLDTSMIRLLNNDLRNIPNQGQIGMIQLPFQIASNESLNCIFSIKNLENAEVLGLLDNRFIVTIINVSSTETKKNVITLFDQHAVDERIRFETLLNGYRDDNGSFRSSDLIPPVTMTVDHNHMKIIKGFVNKFEFIGLKFSIHGDTLSVTGVPKCLLKRAEKENSTQCKELLEQGIKNLLHEQIETLLKTGVVLSRPETLTSIIAFEACRGAIKFGDSISLATAQLLLKKLSQCKTPYQCAHGRPVLAPIIELPQSQ